MYDSCDVDWGRDVDSRRSTIGFTFLLTNGAINQSSKRQPIVMLSNATDVEYMAITQVIQEAMWLRTFFVELNFPQKQATIIFANNQKNVSLINNPMHHSRSKQINVHHHDVRKLTSVGEVVFKYCGTAELNVDFSTKKVSRTKHYKCMERSLGLK